MKALRIVGQTIVHTVSEDDDFYWCARTACDLHVDWKSVIETTITLDPNLDAELVIGEPVNEPVDCMTCLVRIARS